MNTEKKIVAKKALDYVKDGMTVGLGSGSTASLVIKYIGELVRNGLKIRGIPTSEITKNKAITEKIPIIDFKNISKIDICIDGVDEIDKKLNMIKGGGGALLREKIVASASEKYIIIGDSSKMVNRLGNFPLPVEVIPFGFEVILEKLEGLGLEPKLRYEKNNPFITDEGNYIIDCNIKEKKGLKKLQHTLNQITGIVENGLFLNMCDLLIITKEKEIIIKEK